VRVGWSGVSRWWRRRSPRLFARSRAPAPRWRSGSTAGGWSTCGAGRPIRQLAALGAVTASCSTDQVRAVDITGLDEAFREPGAGEPELYRRAIANPPGARDSAVVTSARWRAAEIPAVNGHGTGRGVAGFYAALLEGRVLADKRRLLPPYVSPASGTAPASLVDVLRDVSPFHSTPAATVASRSFSDGLKAPVLPHVGPPRRASVFGRALTVLRLATATAYPELGERRPDLHGSKWRREETSASRLRRAARAPPRRPGHSLGHASQLPNGVACGSATGFMRPTRRRILW
jgi:hypothetical protein